MVSKRIQGSGVMIQHGDQHPCNADTVLKVQMTAKLVHRESEREPTVPCMDTPFAFAHVCDIVDCQQPDVYMGTAALKDEIVLHCGVLGLWLCSLWCSCVSQRRDICVFLVALCCNLPNSI